MIIGVVGMGIFVFVFVCVICREGPPSSFNEHVTARYTLRCTSSGSVGQYFADMIKRQERVDAIITRVGKCVAGSLVMG